MYFSWLGLSNCKFPTRNRQINVHKTQKNANIVYSVEKPPLKWNLGEKFLSTEITGIFPERTGSTICSGLHISFLNCTMKLPWKKINRLLDLQQGGKSPRLKMALWVEALAEQVGRAECKSPAPTRNARRGCVCLQSFLQDVWRRKCGWSFPICLPHSRFSEKHCFQRNTMDRDKIGHQMFTGLLTCIQLILCHAHTTFHIHTYTSVCTCFWQPQCLCPLKGPFKMAKRLMLLRISSKIQDSDIQGY